MKLTRDKIKNRFWNSKKVSKIKPKPITFPKEYNGEESLLIFITQLTHYMNLTPKQKRELVQDWIDFLPKLSEVKYLWVESKINQEVFDALCQMSNIKTLFIKYFNGESIQNISNLEQLRNLSIYIPRIKDISPIVKLNKLLTLDLGFPKQISDFSDIGKLDELEGLEISGSMYKNQSIQDLEFLRNLKDLKYLTLVSTNVKSKSLEPVLDLKGLRLFLSGFNFPKEEFEKLRALKELDQEFIEKAIQYKDR